MAMNQQKKEIKRKNEVSYGDELFKRTFFTPLVENETESSMNGFYDLKDNTAFLDYLSEYLGYSLYHFSDDSIADPNYTITSDDTDESITEMEQELQDDPDPTISSKEIAIEPSDVEMEQAVPPKTYFTKKEIQKNRNRGEAYVTKSKKTVMHRKCNQLKPCRRNCKDKITFDDQKVVFNAYWGLGSYNQRFIFISSLIEISEKATQTLKKNDIRSKNRQNTAFYFIETNGVKLQVCKACFLDTFGETAGFIRNVITKKLNDPISLKDNRGKSTPSNKFSDEKLSAIKNHINSFPAYESHYSRRHSSKKYLSSNLSISKMHELYCEENEIISLTKYAQIFHTMNLKFKHPKIDTCNKCDTFKAKIEYVDSSDPEYVRLKDEQQIHHEKADLAYKSKDSDKNFATSNANIKMYTFDLQQCLPTPYLTTSVSYYKRQLNTYNLTIHDCVTNTAYCFMWHEGEGRRGANEIASCLYNHLNSFISNTSTDSIIFYSDSCAGQNKNSYVSTMFTLYLKTNQNIKTIDHKFLEPGHTHMECDVDHALIERKKKINDMKIHHPRDWGQFVRSIGKKNAFIVVDMDCTKFFDFCSLTKNNFIIKKNDKTGFSWHDVKWLRYSKDKIGTIEYKNSLSEEESFKTINILKRGVKMTDTMVLEKVNSLPKISKEKKRDLLSMIDLIDPIFHDFYKNLKDDNVPDVDPDLCFGSSDED